jgi:uncharacterized protein (TIGR02265 family)
MRINEIDHGGFEHPRWDAPYDLHAEIAAAPAHGTIRGMFFDFVLDRVREKTGSSLDDTSRTAFGKYPMREYLALLGESSAILHPGVPQREALRRLGNTVYDEFLSTMVGRAIFSIAGKSFERVTVVAPRAYEACYEPVRVETRVMGPNFVRVTMSPMFVFADTFHVGVWEGAARLYGHEPDVRIKKKFPGYVDYEVRWR